MAEEALSINVTGAGDHVIKAGVPGQSIKVWRIYLTFDAPDETPFIFSLKSGATVLPGEQIMRAGGAIALGMERRRYAMTEPGDDLVISLSGPASVRGAMTIETGDW